MKLRRDRQISTTGWGAAAQLTSSSEMPAGRRRVSRKVKVDKLALDVASDDRDMLASRALPQALFSKRKKSATKICSEVRAQALPHDPISLVLIAINKRP